VKVLFVCTANSCRSQMAEAWARRLLPPGWSAASAGLLTSPISRRTRAVMAEVGLDLDDHHSKSLEEVDLGSFDLVVALSEEAIRFLPPLPPRCRRLDRPVADPMAATGSPEEVRAAFRAGRDALGELVMGLAAEVGGGTDA